MLKPLTKSKRFPPFVSFDIETRGDKFLVSGMTADGETIAYHETASALVSDLIRKRYRGHVFYAHFGGGFDFRLLLPEFRKLYPSAVVKVFQQGKAGRIFMVKVAIGKKTWTFADSYAILPQSLESLGNSFDTKRKKSHSPDFADMKDTPETRAYLANDCLTLWDIIVAYRNQESSKLAGHAVTLASSAMSNFRRRMKASIAQLNEKDEQFSRSCLFGGRVEVYKRKGFDLRLYDVVSMYPYIMKTRPMPVGSPVHSTQWKPGVIGFFCCDITIRDTYIPPIPYIESKGGKLLFPCGKMKEAYVSSIELDKAEEAGLIESLTIHEGLIFRDSEILFAEYVDHFFRLKAESADGSASRMLAKLYLNALFGKFGQGRDKANLTLTDDPKLGMVEVSRDFGMWNEPNTSRASYIIPSISAWITASARAHLYGYLSERSYYADTDSVFTDRPIHSGETLGAMKFEQKLAGETIFLAPKTYANREKLAHKGIPKKGLDGSRIVAFGDFERGYAGERPSFAWETFDGFGEAFPCRRSKADRWGAWDGAYLHKKIRTRSLSVRDTKRVWHGDDSRPIMFP